MSTERRRWNKVLDLPNSLLLLLLFLLLLLLLLLLLWWLWLLGLLETYLGDWLRREHCRRNRWSRPLPLVMMHRLREDVRASGVGYLTAIENHVPGKLRHDEVGV